MDVFQTVLSNFGFPLLLILFAVVMFFSFRRQRKVATDQQSMQKSLGIGDKVMTTSGLYGTVAGIDSDDTLDLEIAPGVVTTWLRLAVREKVNPVVDAVEPAEETEADAETLETVDDNKTAH